MENRTRCIIRPLFMSWYNCALWFGAANCKKCVVDLGPKEGEWINNQRFQITYEELSLLPPEQEY